MPIRARLLPGSSAGWTAAAGSAGRADEVEAAGWSKAGLSGKGSWVEARNIIPMAKKAPRGVLHAGHAKVTIGPWLGPWIGRQIAEPLGTNGKFGFAVNPNCLKVEKTLIETGRFRIVLRCGSRMVQS